MSTPLSITCPHCATRLKLKDSSSVGKKVPCPKCKQPFVVEAPPEPEEDEFEFGEEVSEAEEAMDEEPEPAAPAARRKPAKKSSRGSNLPLIIGGSVVGVLLLAGLGLYAAGVFSGAKDEPPAVAAEPAEPAKPAEPAQPAEPEQKAEQKPADPPRSPPLRRALRQTPRRARRREPRRSSARRRSWGGRSPPGQPARRLISRTLRPMPTCCSCSASPICGRRHSCSRW